MKNVVVLGATGSIGINALEVLNNLRSGYRVLGISANSNFQLLLTQARKYKPKYLALSDFEAHSRLKEKSGGKYKILPPSLEGLCVMASLKEADIVINAISGAVGFAPLISSIRTSKKIALSNKEPMVMAGPLIMKEAERWNARIIPVDSEPSAIFQCLECLKTQNYNSEISRIFLTASGGPFYRKKGTLRYVTPKMALKHPNWKMGPKITVDSATLMNKGLEAIEIMNFFNVPIKKINVVVHPQSIVHSAVELKDGSVLAQLSQPDMRLPIQYAITYPERFPSLVGRIDLFKLGKLNFIKPDFKKFPCLEIAMDCAKKGGAYPCILNAANEVAVNAFLKGRISFTAIAKVLQRVLSGYKSTYEQVSLSNVAEIDDWAREKAFQVVSCTKQGGGK